MGQCEAPDYSVKFCKVLSVALPPMRMGLGYPGRVLRKCGGASGCQTLLWSCSVGLSEAEDWLGREASRASEDADGDLYRK